MPVDMSGVSGMVSRGLSIVRHATVKPFIASRQMADQAEVVVEALDGAGAALGAPNSALMPASRSRHI